ncbi:MAG: hypothetical protein LUE96_01630 [Lachnospiraceae bacterium]|nr:hypothetical protein [Lachnospiraceae bacterium]
MRAKIKTSAALIMGAILSMLCGCAAEENYFSSVTEMAKQLKDSGVDGELLISDFLDSMCDTQLTGGAHEKDGIFTYYINEDDAYYEFDLSELTDETEKQYWTQAGAFRRADENATYLCWSNFDLQGNVNPAHDLAVVRFDTDDPADYEVWIYSLETENALNTDISCYGLGDSLYVMWRDTQGMDRLGVIESDMGEIRDLSAELSFLKEYVEKEFSGDLIKEALPWSYCVLAQDNGVVIYGADVREASDMPNMGLAFMAVSDGEAVGFMKQ